MLEVLRKKGVNQTILWFIAVVIILSFGVFGTAYRIDNIINSAGSLYGHNVTFKEFQQAYDDARDQAIRLYGDEFFKNAGKIDLEQEAWDRLMLIKEAQNRGIEVSDQEVVNFIASIPFFRRDGQFDQELYTQIVQNPEIFARTPQDFENGVRKQLMIKKLLDIIAPDQVMSDAKLKQLYQKRNEKLTLQYVLFAVSDYAKKASATDQEIAQYYDTHKADFRTAPSIVLNYVQTKDKALADSLSKELTPGTDFATVAKSLKLQMQTSAAFTQDQPILTFASDPDRIAKFFAMKPGDYSQPLEVPDGWQVVQLKTKIDSNIPALGTIKDKVKEAALEQKAFSLAKPDADKALQSLTDALKTTKDFKAAATALGLKVEETPSFGRRDYIANTGLVQEFQQDADQLNADKKMSGVISTSQGPAIIYLEKQEKPTDEEFESDKANFREQMNAEQRNQILITFMTQLRVKADLHSKIKHQG